MLNQIGDALDVGNYFEKWNKKWNSFYLTRTSWNRKDRDYERLGKSVRIVVHRHKLRRRDGLRGDREDTGWPCTVRSMGLLRRIQSHRYFRAIRHFHAASNNTLRFDGESVQILGTRI